MAGMSLHGHSLEKAAEGVAASRAHRNLPCCSPAPVATSLLPKRSYSFSPAPAPGLSFPRIASWLQSQGLGHSDPGRNGQMSGAGDELLLCPEQRGAALGAPFLPPPNCRSPGSWTHSLSP